MAQRMEIETSIEGHIAIVRLEGRLTVGDTPGRLKQATTSAAAQGARVVLLELSCVPYIDSTRLGELIAAHITVTRQGGRFALGGATSRITDLLTLAGLEDIFERFESLSAARSALDA